LAKDIPLDNLSARRSALEKHCNSLFDAVAADSCWTADNRICVKNTTLMVKEMSTKMYDFDDSGLTPTSSLKPAKTRVLQTITNSSPFSLKRSHSDISTSSCGGSSLSNSNQGFPAYYASAYNTENVAIPSPADASKKVCRVCDSVNRVIAIMCSSCQTRFKTIPRVMPCDICLQEIDSGMRNCDMCGAVNHQYDGGV